MNRLNLFAYNPSRYPLFVFLLGVLFFFPFLGYLHLFDWDEINFAESSREMLVSGDYFHVQINYMPFWEKPPLFMWLQSSCMGLFGVNEFAARFPNALFGLITLLSIYSIGKKHMDAKFGMMWALVYLMSFLPHIYFKSGIIDPVFNYFIFMSIYFLIRTIHDQKNKYALLGGLFAGLAILTKGPVGLLLILLTYFVYQCITKFKNPGKIIHILLFALASACITVIWILPEIAQNGFSTLGDFITYQIRLLTTGDAGHEQPFFYHPLVVFVGCFPMSIFALPLFRARKFESALDLTKWMMVLFWVVMILFTIVKTKIVHYSSMCWLPLSFCASYYLHTRFKDVNMSKTPALLFLTGGILFSLLLIALPIAGVYRQSIIPLVKDQFAVACMKQDVPWQLWTVAWGVLFLAGIVAGYFYLRRNAVHCFLTVQSVVTGLVLFGFLLTVVPNIEKHSQGPAIQFYEKFSTQKVYLFPVGFKSYAHYFYGKVPQENNAQRQDETFLLYGKLDRHALFVTKANSDFLDQKKEGFRLLFKEGGFKFYERIQP
ncbi:MAG TPA: glycosyltransferase family 39 protein [Flavobacteriales bacterium]|nr:glycosyltransferase family 39 protein [Flavobacteriales bacterium]